MFLGRLNLALHLDMFRKLQLFFGVEWQKGTLTGIVFNQYHFT